MAKLSSCLTGALVLGLGLLGEDLVSDEDKTRDRRLYEGPKRFQAGWQTFDVAIPEWTRNVL